MTNIKTTSSGVLAAVGVLCEYIGIPKEVGEAITILGLFLMGLFAGDAKK